MADVCAALEAMKRSALQWQRPLCADSTVKNEHEFDSLVKYKHMAQLWTVK